jgi:hypothetical protein
MMHERVVQPSEAGTRVEGGVLDARLDEHVDDGVGDP